MAPFLAARVDGGASRPARLLECRRCGLRFFDLRLDDAEIARLYDGYRDERYLRERRRHEPWYTRRANRRLGLDDAVVRARRAALSAFLARHLDVGSIDSVLDFGGDRGQLIPPGVGRERWVFEISGVAPVPSVRGIRDEASLGARSYDLILLAEVLEHASDPAALLAKVAALGHEGSVLYLEVPHERPWMLPELPAAARDAWLGLLLRHASLARLVHFYSTAFRVGARIVPPLGFVAVHEHLNFFHAESLRALCARVGLSPIVVEELDGLVRALVRLGPARVASAAYGSRAK